MFLARTTQEPLLVGMSGGLSIMSKYPLATKLTQYIKNVDLASGAQKAAGMAKEIRKRSTDFVKGPLRSTLLIGKEAVALVLREQNLTRIPELSQWPHAKAQYVELVRQLIPSTLKQQYITGILQNLGNLTWGQVQQGVAVSAQLVSLYYIGFLAGSTAGMPFGALRRRMR